MIAPVPYGHCLGALEVLLNSEIYNFPITRRQAFQKRSIQACSFIMFLLLFCYPGLNEKGEEVSWRTALSYSPQRIAVLNRDKPY